MITSAGMPDTRRLARRPEARAFSIESLLQLALDGKLRVPEFQRPQRWRSPHVLSLFDSVARGFPIGPLLFSRQKAPAGVVKFGPVAITTLETDGVMWVVDGQQRLTALVGAMLHPDPRPRGDIHAIWYDLAAEAFKRLEHRDPPLDWIPLNVVGDSAKLMRWLRAWPLSGERPELEGRAFELSKAMREYQAPAYIVEDADEDVLRLIFKRINTAGIGMREAEVFAALHGRGQSVKAACARLEAMQWGELAEDDVVEALKTVAGIDPRERFRSGERDLVVPDDAMMRTEAALRRTITFLRDVAEIPHISLLPYKLPLRILARFFGMHPNPTPRVELLLVRWVWRGALSGQHADNGDVVVDRLQRLIGAHPDAAATGLLAHTSRELTMPSALDRWNGRHAKTRLCALGMLHLGPLDPLSGRPLVRASRELQLSKLAIKRSAAPPRSRRAGPEPWPGRRIHNAESSGSPIAERFILGSRERLRRLLGEPMVSSEVLASHGLDAEAVALIRSQEVAEFVRRRATLLDPQLHRFFRERAEPDDLDRPAIATIVAAIEGARA